MVEGMVPQIDCRWVVNSLEHGQGSDKRMISTPWHKAFKLNGLYISTQKHFSWTRTNPNLWHVRTMHQPCYRCSK